MLHCVVMGYFTSFKKNTLKYFYFKVDSIRKSTMVADSADLGSDCTFIAV